MLGKEILLAVISLSAGFIVSGGLFAFLSSLGVVGDIADRTHTGKHILLYEDATILGGVLGNVFWLYKLSVFGGRDLMFGELFRLIGGNVLQGIFGIFSGIFVGCWAMSLAETLNVFPVFIRRTKLVQSVPYIILSIAIGKGLGLLVYFFFGW